MVRFIEYMFLGGFVFRHERQEWAGNGPGQQHRDGSDGVNQVADRLFVEVVNKK